ncbi:HA2-domain-containing protein [Hanseniaspora valbyensis NRRL Y-1626]|uniref:RNA helicase n=1 Tax=Hanseniaspora valbyensis NRRL Y-1626 TaxID=766949 RepID=A0A1B7T9L4_9ASCO|nr:HA2-domain-containing protein [Hanseniaspora valbyensis NRRL Y-1626]
MDPPAPETMMRALEELYYLKCLDEDGNLTELGRLVSLYPLDPMLAVMLVKSCELKCAPEMLTIVSMLSVPNVFVRPGKDKKRADDVKSIFTHPDGDHLTLLNVYHGFKSDEAYEAGVKKWCFEHYLNHRSIQAADNIRNQLERMMERHNLDLSSNDFESPIYFENIKRALAQGFFMQAAKKKSNSKGFLTVKDNQQVLIHPSSVLSKEIEWVIYNEFVLTTQNYIRTVTGIKPEWLFEYAPAYFNLDHFMPGDVKMSLERIKERLDVYAKLDKKREEAKMISNSSEELKKEKKEKKEKKVKKSKK